VVKVRIRVSISDRVLGSLVISCVLFNQSVICWVKHTNQ